MTIESFARVNLNRISDKFFSNFAFVISTVLVRIKVDLNPFSVQNLNHYQKKG